MQQRDRYTSPGDFLDDDSFRKWVLEGVDPYDWEEWTVESPQRASLVDEARTWLLAMHWPEEQVSGRDMQDALQATWQKIGMRGRGDVPARSAFWRSAGGWVAASVLLLGAVLGGLYILRPQPEPMSQRSIISYPEQPASLLTRKNTGTTPLLILLADGSSVLLQPNSTLRYPAAFEEQVRRVYLSGDGFFEISKNLHRPFYVYANEVVTKVVGTSFRIKAFSDESNVEVVVRTGKVNVQAVNSQKEGMLLLPNQGVRVVRQSLAFEKIEDLTQEKTLSSELSNIEKLSFEFTDVPVSQIFRTIEQAYRVTIDFPAEKLADCYLTTSLSDQPLSEKLKIVCESLGGHTRYTLQEDHITIQSNGCN